MQLLPGVSPDYVFERLGLAPGNEVQSGKFGSSESSAALAANCFAWFHDRPGLLPPFPGLEAGYPAASIDIEYCARFPWSGGRHPWLDAAIRTPTHFIGVESKRYEPFRDKKVVDLSEAYDRPVWGMQMGPFERIRDRLRSEGVRYEHLDAAQLVKHAFGLVTEARRLGKKPILVYLFCEPRALGGRIIPDDAKARHRNEVASFSSEVSGAEVGFHALSYREWIASWAASPAVIEHGRRCLEAFNP